MRRHSVRDRATSIALLTVTVVLINTPLRAQSTRPEPADSEPKLSDDGARETLELIDRRAREYLKRMEERKAALGPPNIDVDTFTADVVAERAALYGADPDARLQAARSISAMGGELAIVALHPVIVSLSPEEAEDITLTMHLSFDPSAVADDIARSIQNRSEKSSILSGIYCVKWYANALLVLNLVHFVRNDDPMIKAAALDAIEHRYSIPHEGKTIEARLQQVDLMVRWASQEAHQP